MSTLNLIKSTINPNSPISHIGKEVLVKILKFSRDGKIDKIEENMRTAVDKTDLSDIIKNLCCEIARKTQKASSYSNAMILLYDTCGNVFKQLMEIKEPKGVKRHQKEFEKKTESVTPVPQKQTPAIPTAFKPTAPRKLCSTCGSAIHIQST
jgi:ribosomal protein S1